MRNSRGAAVKTIRPTARNTATWYSAKWTPKAAGHLPLLRLRQGPRRQRAKQVGMGGWSCADRLLESLTRRGRGSRQAPPPSCLPGPSLARTTRRHPPTCPTRYASGSGRARAPGHRRWGDHGHPSLRHPCCLGIRHAGGGVRPSDRARRAGGAVSSPDRRRAHLVACVVVARRRLDGGACRRPPLHHPAVPRGGQARRPPHHQRPELRREARPGQRALRRLQEHQLRALERDAGSSARCPASPPASSRSRCAPPTPPATASASP